LSVLPHTSGIDRRTPLFRTLVARQLQVRQLGAQRSRGSQRFVPATLSMAAAKSSMACTWRTWSSPDAPIQPSSVVTRLLSERLYTAMITVVASERHVGQRAGSVLTSLGISKKPVLPARRTSHSNVPGASRPLARRGPADERRAGWRLK